MNLLYAILAVAAVAVNSAAESAFATTTAATDADDVATMSIESEGNFNPAMVNMLRGVAGVVSLRNNKDSFNEVEASLAQCMGKGIICNSSTDCCSGLKCATAGINKRCLFF